MKKEQVLCTPVDISLTSCEVFEKFASQPWAVFLDSADPKHCNARYDIIAFNPIKTIEAIAGCYFLDNKKTDIAPFELIKTVLAECNTEKAPNGLPFSGGIIGQFSYDLGRYLEQVPSIAKADISLADLAVGLYPDALIFDHHINTWFYVAQPHFHRLDDYLALIFGFSKQIEPFTLLDKWQSNMTQAQYADKFNRIQAYLRSGDCYQINLAQRFSAPYSGDPWAAYLKLRAVNQAPFSAFINLPQASILSISPERFIQVKDKQVETKPIKGTQPRNTDPAIDKQNALTLANSTKDRAENVMIVDLLRNDLGKVAAPGSVKVPKLFDIESFAAVHHLVSTVTSTLGKGRTATDQLKAAFPGGSITGAPKIRAMEIIEELEPHRRSIYCGSIGYISACGNMDTNITIRTLLCEKQKIYCWAGGGIVIDSKVDAEYQETYDKVNKILPVL